MNMFENNEIKNAAPTDGNESGLNNRDQIPTTNYYTTNETDVIDDAAIEQPSVRLSLCGSKDACIGQETNKTFTILPMAVTQFNAKGFFRYDHTPISFKNGESLGENFDYATAVPFDVDNSDSDNPVEWISPDDIIGQLKQLGINFWMTASRNHLLPKDGKVPRPKFHVFLPLSTPLHDSDQFVCYCKWCIKTFHSDQSVKSKAQKIFGYGDNPNAFVESWTEGRCIDEVLADDDLIAVITSVAKKPESKESYPQKPLPLIHSKNTGKCEFGRLKQHLTDTEQTFALAQHFCGLSDGNKPDDPEHHQPCPICQAGDDRFYFRPDGETFHCRVCEFNGDIISLVAKVQDLSMVEAFDIIASTVDYSKPLPPIVNCGVTILDSILEKISPIDWSQYKTIGRNVESKPPGERDYILRTVEQVLFTGDKENTPIVNHANRIHYFTGTHYKPIDDLKLQNFLIEAAIRCGVPSDVAVYQLFVDKICKQFMINSARHNSGVAESDTPYINLQNGTLFFDKKGHRFESHSTQLFIRYCLNFDYDEAATAPLWQKHLDRSLPNMEKQQYLAECLALPFYRGKIEKAPLFYGRQDTGKSTTLDVYKVLVGMENFTTESLAALTLADYHGDYARARLDGKLVNIASDISAKICDEGMAKTLISRERVPARHPYGDGFDMQNYGRLIFAMNDLPHQFFNDAALTKRAAIITFDQQILPQDKDTDFAEKIIANELPGVLNWIIAGLNRLLETGRLDAPQCCIEEMDQMKKEADPLHGWLDERGYQRGKTTYVTVKAAYPDFVEYCKAKNNVPPSDKKFTKRLRDLGYEVYSPNGHVGVVLFYTKPSPKYPAPYPLYPLPPEYQSGHLGQASHDSTSNRLPFFVHSPVHSPSVPLFDSANTGSGNEGNVGNVFSGQDFDGVEGGNRPQNTMMQVVALREQAQVVETAQGLAQTISLPYGMTKTEKIG